MIILIKTAEAQKVIQQVENAGLIDWSTRVIKCTGVGLPEDLRDRAGTVKAAELDALRKILETVKAMNLTSEITVGDVMTDNEVVRVGVEDIVKNFRRVGEPHYFSDFSVEVEAEMDINGDLANILFTQKFGGGTLMPGTRPLCPVCGQPWPRGKPIPSDVQLIPSARGAGGMYTGLIVDTQGLGVGSAIVPRILNEEGDEIYSSRYVNREYAVEIGMVGYSKDLNEAMVNERVAGNPLIIKGIKTAGPNKTDVVISNTDAALVHSAAATMDFMDHCQVIFVVD